jgi:hypothetical protein
VEKVKSSTNLRAKYHLHDRAPKFMVRKTDYGLLIGVRRNAEERDLRFPLASRESHPGAWA